MNYQDGFEFEHRCAAFLKTKGYRKVSVTPPSGDQGIDVIAYKSGVKYGIQCKYYSAPVGNKAVQEAYSGARFYDCDRAVVMTNHTFTKAARELADKLEVELWEHCSPGRETGKFRKLIHAFLFLFLLAGIAAGASMQIFQYPKPSLLNYLDVFLAVTASLLGIFGWRFLSLNLLSGALYLILFFLLLFSGAAKILPSEVLPVFLLPAVLLSGHAIFLQRQKSSDSDGQDSTDHQRALSNQNTGKAYTRLLSQGLRSKVQFLSSEEADYGEKFLYHIDECSAKDLALLEKEMNRSMKDHYSLQRINNSQFYLHRIPKKNKKNQDSSD